jgi:hypothetical protein
MICVHERKEQTVAIVEEKNGRMYYVQPADKCHQSNESN